MTKDRMTRVDRPGARRWASRAAHVLLLASAVFAAPARAQTATPAPPVQRIHPSKIILVGDSTMQANSGWGGSFCAYHVTSFLTCVNLGRGGRSTGSYRAEGSWDIALSEMATRGYANIWVLIQFGHNDQPGKPGRSTDLATEFPANLRRYVTEVRAAGATPVLATPLTRRMFERDKLANDLIPWANAIRAVAREMKVPLIDLNAESAAAVEAMGIAEADSFAQLPPGAPSIGMAPAAPTAAEVAVQPMAKPKLAFDRTHLGRKGADYFAAMVTRELSESVAALRPFLLP